MKTRIDLLREMIRIRCAEERLAELYAQQEMRTPVHFAMGQEATAVGICAALTHADVAYSNHRCHAHYLAKGGDLRAMVAELYGRSTGCAKGRGGSVHLCDPSVGLIASTAILAQTIPVAVGSAWSLAMDGKSDVAVCFFGDGAAEEGAFHESLNFAAVRKVPVLFVCENNGYSIHTPIAVRQPAGIEIWQKARAAGVNAAKIDGNDVFGVAAAANEAVRRMRAKGGPELLECMTYRVREHVGPNWDFTLGYRTKDEVDGWIARDPIVRAARVLADAGECTDADVGRWHAEARAETDEAVAAARAAPFPPVSELLDGAY